MYTEMVYIFMNKTLQEAVVKTIRTFCVVVSLCKYRNENRVDKEYESEYH